MGREITPDGGRPYQRAPQLIGPEAFMPRGSGEPREPGASVAPHGASVAPHGASTPARRGPTSAVVRRVDPLTLEKVGEALLVRDPPRTIRQVYQQFNLAQRAVTYESFRRYARRARMAADVAMLDPDSDGATAMADRLPDLVAELLLDLCGQPAPASRTVHRLSLAFRAVTNTILARQRAQEVRVQAQEAREREKQARELERQERERAMQEQREREAKAEASRNTRAEFAELGRTARALGEAGKARERAAAAEAETARLRAALRERGAAGGEARERGAERSEGQDG